jgi:hypothetical protein
MKTAISLPDQVFYEAEETAHYMGIPRSKLYLNALLRSRRSNTPQLAAVKEVSIMKG